MNALKKYNLIFLILLIFLFDYIFSSHLKAEGNDMGKEGEQTEEMRKPAWAGPAGFYPADTVKLTKEIADFYNKAKKEEIPGKIVALISPHAGYIYSGQVAAYGYKTLEDSKYQTVVVISPTHAVYFKGASIYNGKAYQTTLGTILVDKELALELSKIDKRIYLSDVGHSTSGPRAEHALEVQLPFLQIILGNFKLIPIVLGPDDDYGMYEALGKALAKVLKGKDALIVASSDLSHYHPYTEAERLDSTVIKDVNAFNPRTLFEDLTSNQCEACGGGPIISAMIAAKELGANKAKVVKYANSGDVTGDKAGVVGYMSAVLYNTKKSPDDPPERKTAKGKVENKKTESGLSDKDKAFLLKLAKETIECKVKGTKCPDYKITSEILKENRGAFVTIKKRGDLRGCIGYIQAIKPLYQTVQEMAEAAALNDPRFEPVTQDELKDLEIEISVLTPLKKITDANQIQVGVHGILLRRGYYSGLLLPQVATENHWDRKTFLEQTCFKAGMYDKDCWKDKDAEIYIFSAEVF
jgi:AmmeMemoRadiSam system protein B/AmmeMemoRadiSam system protein A